MKGGQAHTYSSGLGIHPEGRCIGRVTNRIRDGWAGLGWVMERGRCG
jgi:hypothetical protein